MAEDGFNAAGGSSASYNNLTEWEGTIIRGEAIDELLFNYDDGTVKTFVVDADGLLSTPNGRTSGSIEPDGDYFYKNSSYSPVGYYYNSLTGVRQ